MNTPENRPTSPKAARGEVHSTTGGQKGPGDQLLIKNGWVVSVDPVVGVTRADILIDGELIAAIGPNLSAPSAQVIDASERIVLPGFVDAHRHTWQSSIRHIGGDWDLNGYFGEVFFGLGARVPAGGRLRGQPHRPAGRS